jgi:hypothetical protein
MSLASTKHSRRQTQGSLQEDIFDEPVPRKAQPIQPHFSSNSQVWTRKSRILVKRKKPTKPIIQLDDNLDATVEYDRLDLITDAVVHVNRNRKKSAIAW